MGSYSGFSISETPQCDSDRTSAFSARWLSERAILCIKESPEFSFLLRRPKQRDFSQATDDPYILGSPQQGHARPHTMYVMIFCVKHVHTCLVRLWWVRICLFCSAIETTTDHHHNTSILQKSTNTCRSSEKNVYLGPLYVPGHYLGGWIVDYRQQQSNTKTHWPWGLSRSQWRKPSCAAPPCRMI